MSENRFLKELLKKRLDDAVEDIFEIFERTVAEYEEQIRRQRRTLESVLSPTVSLQRPVLGPEHVLQKKEESAPYSPDISEALVSADSDSEQTDHSSDYIPDQDQDYTPDQDQDQDQDYISDQDQDLPSRPATPDLSPNVRQEPASYSCSVCTKGFRKNSSLQQHLKTCKKTYTQIEPSFTEGDYSCSICNDGFTYSEKIQLTNHMMIHFNATGKCLVCDKVISKHEQRRHMMIHSGEKPFSCSVCNKGFIKRYSCERHQAACKSPKTVAKRTPVGQRCKSRDKNIKKRKICRERCKCKVCGRSFMKNIALKNHLKICTKKTETPGEDGGAEKTFSCSVCKETFSQNSKLTDHMTSHRDAETGQCLVCDVIVDKKHLRKHMMIHSGEQPMRCPVCTKLFVTKNGIRKHLKICKNLMEPNLEEQGVLSCSVCNERFENNLLLAVHMTNHADDMDLGCDKMLENDLQLHIINQKKPSLNLCSVCGKLFSSKANLNKHMLIHAGVRPFSCTVCGQTFRLNFDKKRHMMLHTGEKPFTCKFCNKGFLRRSQMRKHMSVHVQNNEMLEQEDAIICNNCGSGFNRDLHFKRHLIKCQEFLNDRSIHQNTYSCSVCAERFTEREALADHLTTHKGGAQVKVNCAICGKTFPSVEMKHHMRCHSKERPFICEICGKGFKRSDHLKGHLLIHSKDPALTKLRPKEKKMRVLVRFECEICGKEFKRKSNLKFHLKRHRKEGHAAEQETCSCPVCAFPCVSFIHQDTTESQIDCPSCKRSFGTEQV